MNNQAFTIIALLVTGFYGWAKTLGMSKPLKILIATITAVGLAFLEMNPLLFERITLGLAVAFSVAGLISVPGDMISSVKKTVTVGKKLLKRKEQ